MLEAQARLRWSHITEGQVVAGRHETMTGRENNMNEKPRNSIVGHAAVLLCTMYVLTATGDSQSSREVAEEAITLSGQRITLYKDGSWEYKKAKELNEVLFRSVPWGATADEIKQRMKGKPAIDRDDLIVYQEQLNTSEAGCCFIMVGGRFVRGKYVLTEEHVNDNLFLSDFDGVDALLTKKYGTPGDSRKLWRDDLYKDRQDDWGMAVKTGRLTVCSQWRVEKVTITHMLRGDNFEVEHGIEYHHTDMGALEDSLRLQETQEKL